MQVLGLELFETFSFQTSNERHGIFPAMRIRTRFPSTPSEKQNDVVDSPALKKTDRFERQCAVSSSRQHYRDKKREDET